MRLFAIAILIGILCMFYAGTSQSAELTILDNTVLVKTDAYEVQFENGVITELHNKLTAETYTLPLGIGGHSGLLRKDSGHVWTSDATLISARKVTPLKSEIVFRQGQNELRLFIGVDVGSGDLLIQQEGTSDRAGVYGIQWGCGNLDTKNLDLILPADGGQIINARSPFTSESFNYPGSWEVQLAIIQGQQGGFSVRGTDATFQFKVLHYQKDVESFALGFETQNQAPFKALTSAQSVSWRLNTYEGDWRVPARQYRDWMEQTFKPWRLDQMPAWVKEIGLVVIYAGLLDTNVLDKLAEQVDPTKTLLYIVDRWRKDNYDVNYPDYTVRTGFDRFLGAARRHRFRVILHTNLLGVSTYHPVYADLQKFQFREPWNGNLIGWLWDKTESPNRHAFINPASSRFRKFFVEQLKTVWQKYRVDGFHLDVSHLVVNDANGLIEGLNAAQGNVILHEELVEAMPGVVFSGERLHEVTFFRENFAQRWKLSPGGEPHPVSTFLFFPYTSLYGYLGIPNPDTDSSLYQEVLDSHESWGILPTFRFESVEQLSPKRIGMQKLLSIARAWQRRGLKPDFESDWTPNTLFQYVGEDGEIATLKKTETGATLVLPEENLGYERVFGVTQVKTDRSLPHWHAYNETELLGLDPKKSYLLSDTPRDSSHVHINVLPQGVSVTESRVTENAALFRLERPDVSREIDLLSQFHLVRRGTILNGEELPLQKGATFQKIETSVSGIRKAAIDAHPPYQGEIGDTFGEWTLSLPDSPNINLEFDIGMPDFSEYSDGVTFIVSVQGNEIFRQHHSEQKWEHISLNLTPYQGKHITLRFITNPGPKEDTGWDSARWGEPKIVSEPSDAVTKVGFFLPNEPIKHFPDTVKHIGQGQYSLETTLPAQILFLFEPVQQVIPPYSLRDAEFLAGLQFDGIFRPGSVWASGERIEATSGGVRKKTISAHPPNLGQTLLQFLLSVPQAEKVTFSFSIGLPDESWSTSDGVLFKVMLNGQAEFEHFTKTPGWVDAQISLSELSGEFALLELVTDSGEHTYSDSAQWADLLITTDSGESNGDVNQDGTVNILDLVLVGQNLGQKPPSDPKADVNKDGQINILDLVFIAEHLGKKVAAAPSQMDIIKSTASSPEQVIAVQRALHELETVPEKSRNVKMTIQFLRLWLENANRNVRETKLLPNYPNPFNPETWIPYQLAKPADVSVKIYDVGGRLVRTIVVGFKPVGYYLTRERAAYWNGRNETGESVSSGVYFLQFIAGKFSATRQVVILK